MKTRTGFDVGRNVRTLRKARGWSLHELARATGGEAAVSTLSELERDRLNPSLRTLEAVAAGLGVAVADLLSEAPSGRWETCPHCGGEGKVWGFYA